MSKYERAFGSGWDALDKDDAIERAYALGVAASMDEFHPGELEAIREEMDTAYAKSVVDLAFEEGNSEATALEGRSTEESGGVWSELVAGETTTVAEDEVPTGGRSGLPEAIDSAAALERIEVDSREAQELPEFLRRD